MAVKLFIYTLFLLSIGAYFYEVEVDIKQKEKEERPIVTFEDATMYVIDEKEVQRIVQAKTALIYNTKEQLYDAIIVERTVDDQNEVTTDNVRANYLEKKDNLVKMIGDIKYNRGTFLTLNSDELYYDLNTKIVYNSHPFDLMYNGQNMKGKNLYYDANKNFLKADKTFFEIELNGDNNETK